MERAQRTGEEAARRASTRMTEEWMDLVNSTEWRQLAHRFPNVMQELAAAAGGNGVRPAGAPGVSERAEQMAA